jgi:haloacetate dehalogenase
MFEGFEHLNVQVEDGITIHARRGGSGSPVLLLHGYPQTHVMWHKIAMQLAAHHTVVAADLRGYGNSSKPSGLSDHSNYSKRTMALDQVRLMRHLGFDSFALVGHDRGGRVAHRLAADHPQAVRQLAVLDISPTWRMYQNTNQDFARAYWHWFFLIQPAPLPETMIAADPKLYLRTRMSRGSIGLTPFSTEAWAAYETAFDTATIHASCEDYRASAGLDLEHDQTDRQQGQKLSMPVLVLWGQDGVIEKCFDPLKDWAEVASHVSGHSINSGHYLPEEAPEAVLAALKAFLNQGAL